MVYVNRARLLIFNVRKTHFLKVRAIFVYCISKHDNLDIIAVTNYSRKCICKQYPFVRQITVARHKFIKDNSGDFREGNGLIVFHAVQIKSKSARLFCSEMIVLGILCEIELGYTVVNSIPLVIGQLIDKSVFDVAGE